jgi:hypothetical protein
MIIKRMANPLRMSSSMNRCEAVFVGFGSGFMVLFSPWSLLKVVIV